MRAILFFVFIVFFMASCSQIVRRSLDPDVTYDFQGDL